MSFFNQRPYAGSIAKKPRLGPRGPHSALGNPIGDGDPSKLENQRLMSFKEFILNQTNDINEQEALHKYSEYKTDHIKARMSKFFKAHQEEEWFRNKYRPTEMKKLEEAVKESKIKRKEAYQKLIERNLVQDFFIDYPHNDKLSQFLECYSLLLEGASLEDIESGSAHKTHSVSSIFIPHVHPQVDKSMIEEYASTHEGFLRVAMSEAQPDKDFRRRAWITYKQMDHDSLRKLCWEFNSHKFNGQETKAIVNKEMNNRIRYTQFWFCHAKASKADLKNVAKLLTYFEGEDCTLLETLKEYLLEETNAEEQALGVNEQDQTPFDFNQDPELLKALDKAILYLRVVHSYDYYAATEYTGEDDMPQKVGIMFARPTPPSTFGENPQEILKEFIEAHKARIDAFLEKPTLSEIEQNKLGRKDKEAEVESFIFNNTHEKKVGEKYICLLTKKKFTTAEYCKKHIINRCGNELDKVRTDVDFYNNYVSDPKRPM